MCDWTETETENHDFLQLEIQNILREIVQIEETQREMKANRCGTVVHIPKSR